MTTSLVSLQYGLEDILEDFRVARSSADLGRLALLNYCEVRRWAREAQAQELAKRSLALMANFPYASQDDFLEAVDELIAELEHAHCCVCDSLSSHALSQTVKDAASNGLKGNALAAVKH